MRFWREKSGFYVLSELLKKKYPLVILLSIQITFFAKVCGFF